MTNPFPFTPRKYQLMARYDTNELLNQNKHPLIVLPTGTGKTKTAAMIIWDRIQLGEIVYIIAPQIEIFEQLMNDYAWMDPGYINDEGIRGASRRLYICMALSLVNNLPIIPESIYPDDIFTDECHHSAADTWKSIYTFFGSALRIGLTATPLRTDGKPLGDLYTDIVETITINRALKEGYLTRPVVVEPEEWKLLIPMKGDDFDTAKQAELLGDPKIIGDVIGYYERILCGLPALVACSTYEHAKMMTKEFRAAGWISEHIHSDLSKPDRKSILNRTRKGEINLLCTVGIGIEGLDIAGLYGLIWLRRTRSTTIWVQFNGRPMRLLQGKKHCIIIDPIGNTVIHGMPDRVRIWSLDEGEGEEIINDLPPYKTCPNCGVYNAEENLICHWCGYDLTFIPLDGTCGKCKNGKSGECIVDGNVSVYMNEPGCPYFMRRGRQLPTMIDGELVAITTDGQIHDISQRVRKKKEEQKQLLLDREESRNTLEVITEAEKRKVLKDGVFSDGSRRKLFKEALRGMM